MPYRDETPPLWAENGGCHVTLVVECGASCSALRSGSECVWNVIDPYRNQYQKSSDWTIDHIREHLAQIMRRCLLCDVMTLG